MAYYWTRNDYNDFNGKQSDWYPIKTQAAAAELRNRGIDTDYDRLKYLARKGDVSPDGGGAKGSDLRWSADLIDQAAELLASQGKLNSSGQLCKRLNVDYGQFERALREAGLKHLGTLTPDLGEFEMNVHPAENGGHAIVEFSVPKWD